MFFFPLFWGLGLILRGWPSWPSWPHLSSPQALFYLPEAQAWGWLVQSGEWSSTCTRYILLDGGHSPGKFYEHWVFISNSKSLLHSALWRVFELGSCFHFFQDNLYWPQGTPTISCVRDWGTTHLKALNIQYTQSGVRIRIHFVSKLNLNLGWSTDACLLAWRSFFD